MRLFAELYDNMFDLVDGLTFTLRVITPSLWPVFEVTYQRYKTNAADFLDGKHGSTLPRTLRSLTRLFQRCCRRSKTS